MIRMYQDTGLENQAKALCCICLLQDIVLEMMDVVTLGEIVDHIGHLHLKPPITIDQLAFFYI